MTGVGLFNVIAELKLGKKMLAKDHRGIFAIRFILVGIIPLIIGAVSLVAIFSIPVL